MRTVICFALSKRIPARPTAAHAMETTPTTATITRLTRWRLVNFIGSPPARRSRPHEGRQPVVALRCAARVAIGGASAEIDVAGVSGIVDARHNRRARHLHLALLLAATR